MKTLFITNIPSPYLVLQFDKLSEIFYDDLTVIYFKKIESNRKWSVPALNHKHLFLDYSKHLLSFKLKIITHLKQINPETIVASGFSVPVIIAFIYAEIFKKEFIIFTDSWLLPVDKLGWYRKIIRKLLIPRANKYICVGKKGEEFLIKYGAQQNKIYKSPLAVDNIYYRKFLKPFSERKYDLMFSGQFIERKMPFFVIEIIRRLHQNLNNLKFLIIGSGPLENDILSKLDKLHIEYSYPGFIQQEQLPEYYSNAKILLFPSANDPWGLVANEACAVGTPVITCDNAGVAGDLIVHNNNGFVLPLVVRDWVEHSYKLLTDKNLYRTFSKNALQHVQNYSIEQAAQGIKKAIQN